MTGRVPGAQEPPPQAISAGLPNAHHLPVPNNGLSGPSCQGADGHSRNLELTPRTLHQVRDQGVTNVPTLTSAGMDF